MVKYIVEKIVDITEQTTQIETVEADNFVITSVGSLILFKTDQCVQGFPSLNNNVASYNAFAWRSITQETDNSLNSD